jgi:hypothetical protein
MLEPYGLPPPMRNDRRKRQQIPIRENEKEGVPGYIPRNERRLRNCEVFNHCAVSPLFMAVRLTSCPSSRLCFICTLTSSFPDVEVFQSRQWPTAKSLKQSGSCSFLN